MWIHTDVSSPIFFLYTKLKLWVCIFVCSLIPWEQIYQLALSLVCLFLGPEQTLERYTKKDLTLSPGEGGSCRLESKYDRRKVPRPNLFVSMMRLWKGSTTLKKTVLGSSSGKYFSVAQRLSMIEYHSWSQICLFRWADYRNKGHDHKTVSHIQVPMNMIPAARKRSIIKEQGQDRWLAYHKF
jgi:hypothetical protein